MSKIPEEIMGKKQSELGATKPDFGIFEKVQKELDDTVDQINAKADAASAGKSFDEAAKTAPADAASAGKSFDEAAKTAPADAASAGKSFDEAGKTAPADAVQKAAGEVKDASDSTEVNVERIMDSRMRKSLSDTMEVELPADAVNEAAVNEAAANEAPVNEAPANEAPANEADEKVDGTAEKSADPLDRIKSAAEETAAKAEAEAFDAVDKAEEAAGDAADEVAAEAEETAGDTADDVAAKAEETAGDAIDKAKDAAGEVADDAATEAEETAGDAIDKAKDAAGGKADKAKGIVSGAKDEIPSDPRDILKNKIETAKRRKGWHVLLIEAVIIVLAVVITFTVILGSSTVKGTSMEPNYFEGDRVLYFKMASSFEQNDVIIFHTEENRDLIKRVIAVEGDVVDIDDGEVIVNGTPVESLNVSQETEESVSGVSDPVDFPLTVEEDHVFVLGDNRSVSIDSRTKKIGQISKDDIAGRVFFMMRGKTK